MVGNRLRIPSKVGPKGQAVIPKPIRDRAHIVPGDEVVFVWDETGIRVEAEDATAMLHWMFTAVKDKREHTVEELKALREEAYEDRFPEVDP